VQYVVSTIVDIFPWCSLLAKSRSWINHRS